MMAQTFTPLARATVGICVIDAEGKALKADEAERRHSSHSSDAESGCEDEEELELDASGNILPSDPKTLRARIIKQVDFYFGNNNYPKDKFIRKHTRADEDGWIPLAVVCMYKKMKKISQDVAVLAEALLDSAMVEVSCDGLKIRRKNPPARTPEMRVAATVVVDNLRATTTEDDIAAHFAPANVRILSTLFFTPHQTALPGTLADVEDLHPALTDGATERCAIVELEYPDEALKSIRILNRGQDWRTSLHVGAASQQHNPPESRSASGRNTPNHMGDGSDSPKQRRRRGPNSPSISRTNTPTSFSLSRQNSSGSPANAGDEQLQQQQQQQQMRQRCVSLDTARGRNMRANLTVAAAGPTTSPLSASSPSSSPAPTSLSPGGNGNAEARSRSSTMDGDWRRAHMANKQSPLGRVQSSPSERQARSADSSPMTQRRPMTLSPPTTHGGAPTRSLSGGLGIASPTAVLTVGRASPAPVAFISGDSDSARASPRAFSPMLRTEEGVVRQPLGPTPASGFSRGRGKPLPL